MLTPEALRAARGLLKWGVRDIAAASGVSWTTIYQYENGRTLRDSNASKIVAAFADRGIEIVANSEMTGAMMVYSKAGGGGE